MSSDNAAETKFDAMLPNGTLSPPGICTESPHGYPLELNETEIITRYMPLVKRIGAHLKGRLPETVQLDDLIQAGLIAVLRLMRQGAGRANEEAVLRRSIANAMIDEARRESWAPVRTVRLAKAAGQAVRAFKQRTGREGSDAEIAVQMGLPLAAYHQVLIEIAGLRLLPLDEFDEAGEERLQISDSQETTLDQSRMMAALADAITALPERERMVVSLYHEHELNMEEVGLVLDLNKSTVCRTHGRALLMLRNALADWSASAAQRSARGD